jgi:hypothetical protein
VAVRVVWLVTNTTVKGRGGDDIEALRRALRARTTPQPIGPLPVPDVEPKPAAPGQLLKPAGPDALQLFAAGG